MKIDLREITVRELAEDYADTGEAGVRGYGGRLDVRPPFQREFVYSGAQRDAVIETINAGYPLNVMYWAARGDGTYEIIDGQQRTISICEYVHSEFSIDGLAMHNLTADQKQRILDYPLMVYVCTGTDSEKLAWFETINIAGEELTAQELRNAVYAGPWLSDAKRSFSRTGCRAHAIAQDYMKCSAIRQEYLETAIKWAAGSSTDLAIRKYMSAHQHDPNADDLWTRFRTVIDWVDATFPTKRPKLMRTADWGGLYAEHKDRTLDPAALEAQIADIIQNPEVRKPQGAYAYVLTRDPKHLNLRTFSDADRQRSYEAQNGRCVICGDQFELDRMDADHIEPWSKGGRTEPDNCQMLCRACNRAKGAK